MARFCSTRRRSRLFLAAIWVACLNALSTPCGATPSSSATPYESVDRYFSKLLVGLQKSQLDSGLRVLLSVDREHPVVALATCFQAGRAEPGHAFILPDLAAYLRHRRVTPAKPDHSLVRARGAGESEHLAHDHSCFTSLMPASELAFGLWLEARRLEPVAEVPEVAATVARQRYEAWKLLRPHAAAELELARLAWGAGSAAAARTPEGSLAELAFALNQRFSVDNAVLVLVGDFDPDQASRWIREYFSPRDPKHKARQPAATSVEPAPTAAVEAGPPQSTAGQSSVFVGFAHPAGSVGEHAALELLARLLSLDGESRAHAAFLKAAGALDFGAEVRGWGEHSLFVTHLKLSAAANPARAEAELLRRVTAYATRAPRVAELERAKKGALVSWLSELASPERRAALLGRFEVMLGDARLAARQHLALSAVTPEDIQRASKSLVAARRVTLRASTATGSKP